MLYNIIIVHRYNDPENSTLFMRQYYAQRFKNLLANEKQQEINGREMLLLVYILHSDVHDDECYVKRFLVDLPVVDFTN